MLGLDGKTISSGPCRERLFLDIPFYRTGLPETGVLVPQGTRRRLLGTWLQFAEILTKIVSVAG
jgi:hypothetical protein